MSLPSNRFFLGGGGGPGWEVQKRYSNSHYIIKTKNVGENRKNRKSKAPSELMDELN